jgi:SAM-dependent methyltransferase
LSILARSEQTAPEKQLEVALPAPDDTLEQDEEWVVVKTESGWRKIRLHDYGEVYAIPGLYERWVYEILGCQSPQKIRELLTRGLKKADVKPESLCVFDLGAGNGYVAEELSKLGIEKFVGVDIYDEAAEAAERDRPGLYDDYVVGDLLNLPEESSKKLDRYAFNCMTCVAALGFGDIPTNVFADAFNRVEDGGWIAFTIKSDFVDAGDKSGFAALVKHMVSEGILDDATRESYIHRVAADGQELEYVAYVGRKRGDITGSWLD